MADTSGPGMGPCGNSNPSNGPVWRFEFTDMGVGSSYVYITMRNLIAGETGLYVAGLQFANSDGENSAPLTANIPANNGVVVSIHGAWGKIPSVPTPVCKWTAIGPFWPDAPP